MLLDVTLSPRNEKVEDQKYKKPDYDWRFENSIKSGKVPLELDGIQEFPYNQYRTNISLSYHLDTLSVANDMNINYHLTDKMHYHYLFHKVRKMNRYGKKKTDQDKRLEREIKAHQELVALISNYYKYNTQRAREVLSILTDEQIDFIRKKQEKGGVK